MLANDIEIAAALTNFEPHILALHPAQLRERLQEYCDPCLRVRTKSACKHPNAPHDLWPLSLRDNRPRRRSAAEQRDKITPPHGLSRTQKKGSRIKYSRSGPCIAAKGATHVRFGSFSSNRHAPDALDMSASLQKRTSERLPGYVRLHHEDWMPTHGEATREAAMAAFAKSWRRE